MLNLDNASDCRRLHQLLLRDWHQVEARSPLKLDSRSVVLEQTRRDRAVALVRAARGPGVVVIERVTDREGRDGLRVLDPSLDLDLPGASLLQDRALLHDVCGLALIEDVSVCAYHPGRRAVLRVRGSWDKHLRVRYVKLFRRRAFERAVAAYGALAQAGSGLRTNQPLSTRPELAAIVFRPTRGSSLHERLRSGGSPGLKSLARGLAAAPRRVAGLPERTLEDQRDATLKMLDRARKIAPGLGQLHDLVGQLQVPDPGPVGLIHGDLHDKQIFLDAGNWEWIDAEGAARGPLWFDAVNLAEHLSLRSLQGHSQEDHSERFLGLRGVDPRHPSIQWLRGIVRARLAGVYGRRPAWRAVSETLRDGAVRLLTGGGRRLKVLAAALLACAGLPSGLAGQSGAAAPGMGISAEVLVRAEGLVAEEVEWLSNPRSPRLRGRVDLVNPTGGTIILLGRSVTIDPTRTLIEPGNRTFSWADVTPGTWVEVKMETDSAGRTRARSIEVEDVKRSQKVKGTVTAVMRDGSRIVAVDIGDIHLAFDAGTDFLYEGDGAYEDLFGDLRSDDLSGTDRGYTLSLGSRVFLAGSVRGNYRRQDAFALTEDDRSSVGEPGLRIEALGRVDGNTKVFAQVRARGEYELDSNGLVAPSADGRASVHLRQLYMSARELGGHPVGLVLGKQRLRDPREFLFDEYLDAFRLYHYGFLPVVLEFTLIQPVVPLDDGLADWRDLLGQLRYYPHENWRLRLYALARRDRSQRQRNSRYFGLSVNGRANEIRVWAEGALLRGDDKGRPQSASALDIGASARLSRSGVRPYVSVGYAWGSGDRSGSDNISEEFRQSGYDDNSSRTWGVTNFKHYGEALDPELSNLRIITAAMGIRPLPWMSLEAVVHDYRQDRLSEDLPSTDLRVPDEVLSGSDRHLGNGLDVVVGARGILDRLSLGYRVGLFRPGAAFVSPVDVVILQRAEIRVEL